MKGQIGHLLLTAGLTFVALWVYDSVATSTGNTSLPSLT